MQIISHVCAEFHDREGLMIYAVTPDMLGRYVPAPDAIRQDPLFDLLVADGSLEPFVTEERLRTLENNPHSGIDATGKAIRPVPEETAAEEKPAKAAKPARSPKAEKAEQADPVTEPADKAIAAK